MRERQALIPLLGLIISRLWKRRDCHNENTKTQQLASSKCTPCIWFCKTSVALLAKLLTPIPSTSITSPSAFTPQQQCDPLLKTPPHAVQVSPTHAYTSGFTSMGSDKVAALTAVVVTLSSEACLRLCLTRVPQSAKAAPQKLHSKGFSPVCVLWCIFRCDE